MQRQDERDLREELAKLIAEHRELDAEVTAIEATGVGDQLTIRRLKRRKLMLKDHIKILEDLLFPDIIA